jgi:hypothetical protein
MSKQKSRLDELEDKGWYRATKVFYYVVFGFFGLGFLFFCFIAIPTSLTIDLKSSKLDCSNSHTYYLSEVLGNNFPNDVNTLKALTNPNSLSEEWHEFWWFQRVCNEGLNEARKSFGAKIRAEFERTSIQAKLKGKSFYDELEVENESNQAKLSSENKSSDAKLDDESKRNWNLHLQYSDIDRLTTYFIGCAVIFGLLIAFFEIVRRSFLYIVAGR